MSRRFFLSSRIRVTEVPLTTPIAETEGQLTYQQCLVSELNHVRFSYHNLDDEEGDEEQEEEDEYGG